MKTTQNIAFVLFDYPIGVSSMVINSIELFAQKGLSVDIYTNHKNLSRSPIEFRSPNINIHVYNDRSIHILLKVYRFIIRKTDNFLLALSRLLPISLFLILFFPHIYLFSKWLKNKISNMDYAFIIPVEYSSLVPVEFVQQKEKIIYFNMELMDWAKASVLIHNKLIWKTLEFREINQLSNVVLPSETRAKVFAKINHFSFDKLMILPVTSMGEPISIKSRFFRDRFGISEEKKIVIYSGNLKPWALCAEIVDSVEKWPSDYALIMHTWNTKIMQTPYVEKLKEKAKGLPVYFSNEYIEYDQLAKTLSSADIGLAFYEDIDKNFNEILYSSNKIGEYLKAGLAVICSDFLELNKFVSKNQIGSAIPLDKLPDTLKNIQTRIDTYKKNAIACYQNNYRFDAYFDKFYNKYFSGGKAGE